MPQNSSVSQSHPLIVQSHLRWDFVWQRPQQLMMPYNFKVWAHPPKMLNKEWIGQRVSVVDIKKVLGNVILDRDDAGWGPNATFKYPRFGGTGGLFERMRPFVNDNLRTNADVVGIDTEKKEVVTSDGTRESYDELLSTMPIDILVSRMNGAVPDSIKDEAKRLRHSGSLIVGVGIRQPAPSTRCWMYFPEDNCPFYRLTYLSNYSPEVVPDASTHYSILAEISRSDFKEEDADCIIEETIQGLINTKMISQCDVQDIVDTHLIERDYTYPVPGLERDEALGAIHPFLESHNIYSRGRFGAWRYEVGNMMKVPFPEWGVVLFAFSLGITCLGAAMEIALSISYMLVQCCQ